MLAQGHAEHGFLLFSEYLSLWLEAKDTVINSQPAMQVKLTDLISECLGAMQNKDLVTLMDAVEYGFKPLVQQRFACDQTLKVEKVNAGV